MSSNGSTPTAVDWATMPDWITTEEASQISGYERNYLRRVIRQGKIAAAKKGYAWWVDRDSLKAYVELMTELGNHRFDPRGLERSKEEE